jgi:eukaryotic-like serine/threonine-protein kinase
MPSAADMTPERWERVKTLYDSVRARPVPEREALLDEACAADKELRREVEALLRQPVDTAAFISLVGGTSAQLAAVAVQPAVPMIGRRIGTFHISALLGRGGMGEVYRAHDTKLGRDVAIKVLPLAFTSDPGRLAAFEREARVVASLNHPHIAAIHGVEENDGIRGLVLELVEGDTLAERLTQASRNGRRGLPRTEALNYARQIADALEAAHEKGITHRDLKPSNIKITPDGLIKLLDFGIAKVVSGDSPGIDFTRADTVTADGTGGGVIVGTAGYMSPEQARGKPVDKRTDIWAFGCVLYEMFSGRMAFEGETASDTIAAILDRDPDWSTLPADTPRSVRRLLLRCLDKDPRQRLRDIGDARVEIEQIIRAPQDDVDPNGIVQEARTWRRRTRSAAAAAVLLGVVSAGLLWFVIAQPNRSAGDSRVSRFSVDLPPDSWMVPTFNSNLALSADGTMLALTPLPGPVSIRRLHTLDAEPLEVTQTFGFRGSPMFSPDGSSISFVQGNGIISKSRPFLRVALSGGAATKLTDYDNFHGGEWAQDGWIYWTANYPGGIVRIRESGGAVEPVTELDVKNGERSHRFAHLLPGGDALIYTVGFDGIDSYDDARIDLWDLKTRQKKTLITGGTSATYSPSGHLVYARAGKLFAVPFDAGRREVTGSAIEVVDGVMMSRNTGAAHFSISKRGDLAYAPGGVEGDSRTLVWVDRSGKLEPLPLQPASYLYPRIAPDGRSMAVEIEGPNHDFYFYDFARTVLSKVTTDGMSHNPVWSPDGKRLVYRSWQAGGMTMWSMNADRSGAAMRLDPTGTRQSPVSFSPDGKFLAFDQKDGETDSDALILPLGGGPPVPLARTTSGEGSAKFSPDGRWIAYASTESGKPEIYVQPFPGLGPKIQISNAGGTDPVWRRTGGELYYRAANKMMMVTVVTTGPELRASAPKVLFEGAYYEGTGASCEMGGPSAANYDVSADGQRFLMVRDTTSDIAGTRVVVVLNWSEELKAKERARAAQARLN